MEIIKVELQITILELQGEREINNLLKDFKLSILMRHCILKVIINLHDVTLRVFLTYGKGTTHNVHQGFRLEAYSFCISTSRAVEINF